MYMQDILKHTLSVLNVSGPQQPMSRCPDLVEGPSPTADTGTAGVGDLSESTMGDNGFSQFAKKDSPFRQFVAETMLPTFAPTKPHDERSMAELHLGKAIVTTHVRPPVPCRDHDWCAYPDGEEENGDYGWGATEDEAIADLVVILQDNERIPETL
jgi:hypothetical protein